MPGIRYEWDEEKRLANLRKHKLDFEDAWRVYGQPSKVTVEDTYPYEERFRDLALVDGAVRLLIYTIRGQRVRFISYRAATRSEREFYYEEIRSR
jgi:uncharacterized DUF497 family protein